MSENLNTAAEPETPDCNRDVPASLAPADVIKLYIVEYEHGRNRYHTVVEARDIEAAKRQFRRDNPNVEMLSCVDL